MESIDILIIEDDDIVARTIERTLRGHEFHITVANSGVQGLQVARRQPPALVVLDVIMPGMDGYTVCREMRDDPLLAEVPVLFLTAKVKDEDKIAGLSAGDRAKLAAMLAPASRLVESPAATGAATQSGTEAQADGGKGAGK